MKQKLAKNINKYLVTINLIIGVPLTLCLLFILLIPKTEYYNNTVYIFTLIGLFVSISLIMVLPIIISLQAYRLYGYSITDECVLLQSGVLFRKTQLIPIKRIQHLESFQGPLQSLFKQGTLHIYTAGSRNSLFGFEKTVLDQIILDLRKSVDAQILKDEGN